MAVNPSVLILDEPTSQLSSEAAQEFLMLLKKSKRILAQQLLRLNTGLKVYMNCLTT